MTEEDARAVLLGNLEDISTKQAALELGLSYGQVYSCRKGFTFKKVYKEFREAQA
jgi:DNA-directed RNA polymerase specialized sigma24 family protein